MSHSTNTGTLRGIVLRSCVALLLVSCTSPGESAGSRIDVQAEDRSPILASELEGAPTGVRAIRRLLRAFHARDLPSESALRAYDDGERSLLWISEHDELLLVRARALESLRFYDSAETRQRVLTLLVGDAHPKLVAAAAIGSGGLPLSEVHEALHALRAHPDPRVRRAVETRLGTLTENDDVSRSGTTR